MKYEVKWISPLLELKKPAAGFGALPAFVESGGHLLRDVPEQGPPLLRAVFIPVTTEPSPSRESDVSAEEEIETYRNLEGPRMVRNPCISERSRKVGRGDPCMGCMGCDLVLNLTKSCAGRRDNQAFIL